MGRGDLVEEEDREEMAGVCTWMEAELVDRKREAGALSDEAGLRSREISMRPEMVVMERRSYRG